jgi:TPR repeat protein
MHLAGVRVLAAIVVLCASVTLCRSDPGSDAQAAFDRKEYATAIRLWEPLAKAGDTQAQVGLASIYMQGLGVPRDTDKALIWLELAAEGGDPRGPWLLGRLTTPGWECRGTW